MWGSEQPLRGDGFMEGHGLDVPSSTEQGGIVDSLFNPRTYVHWLVSIDIHIHIHIHINIIVKRTNDHDNNHYSYFQ